MQTTVNIPDSILHQLQARAIKEGRPLDQLITEAVAASLHGGLGSDSSKPWMKHFGALADLRQESLRIQEVVEAEFEKIDPEAWQ